MDPNVRANIADTLRQIGIDMRTARTIVRDVDRVLRRQLAHPPAMLATVPDRLDAALQGLESIANIAALPELAAQLGRMSESSTLADQARGRDAAT